MRVSRILTIAMLGMLLTGMAYAGKMVRVVTWNVETIGAKGSPAYNAAREVLNRIGADVVAVQEIASQADLTNLLNLASELGYNYTSIAPGGPFGSDRAAFLSEFPLLVSKAWTAAQLSGDGAAKDLKQTQKKWLGQRNSCTTRDCIENAYLTRIDEICEYPVISGIHPECLAADDIN